MVHKMAVNMRVTRLMDQLSQALGSRHYSPKGQKGFLSDVPDLNFRIDAAAGRVVWTYDGEDYAKHAPTRYLI